MNRQTTLHALRDDLAAAQHRRDEAAKQLDEAMLDASRGIDNQDALERSQGEYRRARQQVNNALMRLSNFMIHEALPTSLKRPKETPQEEAAGA